MALSAADLPAMYSLLTNSLSADQSVRKPAEAALAQSESRPGFCSCLMEVIAAKDLTAQGDVRLMASVYFKNSINRYWRNKRDSMGISSEEKLYLRQKLLAHFREENYQVVLFALISKVIHCSSRLFWQMLFHSLMFYGSIYSFYLEKLMSNLKWHAFDLIQVALTLSVIISKIARIDYPREWSCLQKRLASDQRNFAEISTQFFEYCWHLWQTDVQTILHGFSALAQNFGTNTSELCHDDLYLTCERWFLCSKIVRQLVISGFPSDAKTLQEVRHVKEVSPVLLNAIQSFLPFYSSFQEQHPKFLNFVKQACTKLMKILVAVQQRHPYSFGDKCVLQPIIDSCVKTIVDPDPHIMSFEQFLIQCMIMLKTVLECKEYKATLTGRVVDENGSTFEQMKKNISSSVSRLLASLFYHDRVILLCNVLIRR
nr:importin-11 isoform X1 [Ipomoea batatas]